jgi:hypothetical protein
MADRRTSVLVIAIPGRLIFAAISSASSIHASGILKATWKVLSDGGLGMSRIASTVKGMLGHVHTLSSGGFAVRLESMRTTAIAAVILCACGGAEPHRIGASVDTSDGGPDARALRSAAETVGTHVDAGGSQDADAQPEASASPFPTSDAGAETGSDAAPEAAAAQADAASTPDAADVVVAPAIDAATDADAAPDIGARWLAACEAHLNALLGSHACGPRSDASACAPGLWDCPDVSKCVSLGAGLCPALCETITSNAQACLCADGTGQQTGPGGAVGPDCIN